MFDSESPEHYWGVADFQTLAKTEEVRRSRNLISEIIFSAAERAAIEICRNRRGQDKIAENTQDGKGISFSNGKGRIIYWSPEQIGRIRKEAITDVSHKIFGKDRI